mgnify:CR=1 FL=1
MSHFSQIAVHPQYTNMSQRSSPPTRRGIQMANAFIQIFKYNQGKASKAKYNDTSLYYALFIMDYTETIADLSSFIKKNYAVMIEYMSHHYCKEYKQTENFKTNIKEWTSCTPSEIIYALSTEHSLCFQTLDLIKSSPSLLKSDTIMWVIYECCNVNSDISSSDPCVSSAVPLNTSKKHDHPTSANEWTYYHDGVLGGGDY